MTYIFHSFSISCNISMYLHLSNLVDLTPQPKNAAFPESSKSDFRDEMILTTLKHLTHFLNTHRHAKAVK